MEQPSTPHPAADDDPVVRRKLVGILLVTLVLAGLVLSHVSWMNGPWYWKWPWRRLGFFPLYFALAVAALPFVAAQRVYHAGNGVERSRRRMVAAILLLTLATLALSLTAVTLSGTPSGLGRLSDLVHSPIVNSYFNDAVRLHERVTREPDVSAVDAIANYPRLLPRLHLHSRYKPPGLMLYYFFWVTLLGPTHAAAAAGGIGIAVLGALTVPAGYWLVRTFTASVDAAFCAASLLALAPGRVLFLPMFDTLYPALACVMLVLWARALDRGRALEPAALGAVLALCLFLSYIFLILGLFMVALALLKLPQDWKTMLGRIVRQGLIAAAALGGVYGLLWIVTGFDPIETARVISRLQMRDLIKLRRPFPEHIPFDVLDFMMSGGWITVLLIGYLFTPLHPLLRTANGGLRGFIRRISPTAQFVVLCLLQILTVALAALLPGEAARLWLPMLPLLLAPAAIELTRWPAAPRMLVYLCLWILLAAIAQNMWFVYDPFRTDLG